MSKRKGRTESFEVSYEFAPIKEAEGRLLKAFEMIFFGGGPSQLPELQVKEPVRRGVGE